MRKRHRLAFCLCDQIVVYGLEPHQRLRGQFREIVPYDGFVTLIRAQHHDLDIPRQVTARLEQLFVKPCNGGIDPLAP